MRYMDFLVFKSPSRIDWKAVDVNINKRIDATMPGMRLSEKAMYAVHVMRQVKEFVHRNRVHDLYYGCQIATAKERAIACAETEFEHKMGKFYERTKVFSSYCRVCSMEVFIDKETFEIGGNAIHANCPEDN